MPFTNPLSCKGGTSTFEELCSWPFPCARPQGLRRCCSVEWVNAVREEGRAEALTRQRQGDGSYRNEQHTHSDVHDGLTHNGQHRQRDFYDCMIRMGQWYWLINHSISRNETGKPIEFLLDLYKRKNSQMKKAALDLGKGESWPVNQCPDLSWFTDLEHLE